MSARSEKAVELRKSGMNCAMAIVSAYADLLDMDEDTLRMIAQPFGAGMGTMDGSCGAISGALIVLSLYNRDPRKTAGDSRFITNGFKEKNATIVCRELKGMDDGIVKRSCLDCIRDACELLEEKVEIEQ